MLLSIECEDIQTEGPPQDDKRHKKALIFAFRGTDALKNANVSLDMSFIAFIESSLIGRSGILQQTYHGSPPPCSV